MKKNEMIDSLNGIRGFAVLLVLFSHASNSGLSMHPSLSFSGAGRYGVFLFFVLSAFLLTRQFINENFENIYANEFVKHYFSRRFLRIFPLLTLALIVYFALHKMGHTIHPIDEIVLFKTLLLVDAKGIFWTIPVEFQYYLLLPLVSLMLVKSKKPIIPIVGFSVFVAVWQHFMPPEYAKNLLPFLSIFLLGSLSAYISIVADSYISNKSYLIYLFNFLSIICMSLFIVLIPNYYNYIFGSDVGRLYFHKEFILFALLSCCLVIFTVHSNGVVKKLMESQIFVFWGNVSFSAYLWHMVILKFVNSYIGQSPAISLVIFFALTAVFSYLSFKFIELPLSKGRVFKSIFYNVRASKWMFDKYLGKPKKSN